MPELPDSIGLVEARTIAAGVRILDAMFKGGEVELLQAAPICSGRYLIRIAGTRSSVEAALAAGGSEEVVAVFLLSRVSLQVLQALGARATVSKGMALGLVESRRAASGIAAADVAVKRAAVTLARLAIGQGIQGKSYLVLSGDLAAVDEAVQAAAEFLGKDLVGRTVLANPDHRTWRALAKGAG